jgi:hypothetical protein
MKTCKCCKIEFVSNGLILHDLCDNCFNHFDNQKMRGRYRRFPGYKHPHLSFYFESSNDFVRNCVCPHTPTRLYYQLENDISKPHEGSSESAAKEAVNEYLKTLDIKIESIDDEHIDINDFGKYKYVIEPGFKCKLVLA